MNKKLIIEIILSCVLLLISGLRGFAEAPSFEVRLMSGTVKIFPDETPPGEPGAPLRITAVRNEYAPFQVAITAAADILNISVSVGDFAGETGTIPASGISLYLVENVTIEKPSMVSPRRVWPDPLPPYRDFDVAAGETRAVWADLFVPADTPPGEYAGAATVSAQNGDAATLRVVLDVRDIAIPTAPTLNTAFGLSYGEIGAAHKVEAESPEHRALKDAYYWFLVGHRLSPYHIPVDLFSEEARRYLDDPRVTFLRQPFSWEEDEMRRIADRLKETGWTKKAAIYMVDEPEPSEFQKLREIGEWAHKFDPDIRVLVTHGHIGSIADEVKIWVPVLTYTLDFIEVNNLWKAQKKGKEFWWYTCIGPKWEGTTYFIDDAATAPRLHPWMNYLYGVTGILYWSTTHWGQVDHNPWEKTETYPTGNGDGSLLYPGYQVGFNGPVASQRLKMLREGMEDYELLNVLGETLKETAEKIGGAALEYDPKSRLFEHAYALITEAGRSNPLGEKTPYLMFVSQDYRRVESQREKVIAEIEGALTKPLILLTTEPADNGFTKKKHAVVKGYMEEGCEVSANGTPAETKGNRFRAKVPLEQGENNIRITAELDGNSKTLYRTVFKQ
ncbi:MAG: glycoside hydrolase domain-containing protein [bacterium]